MVTLKEALREGLTVDFARTDSKIREHADYWGDGSIEEEVTITVTVEYETSSGNTMERGGEVTEYDFTSGVGTKIYFEDVDLGTCYVDTTVRGTPRVMSVTEDDWADEVREHRLGPVSNFDCTVEGSENE